MIKISNLSKKFDEKVIFSNASLVIDNGEKVGLVGPNGVGKSTLFRLIIGEIRSDSGEVYLAEKENIAYLPQSFLMESSSTVGDYLGPDSLNKQVFKIMAELDLKVNLETEIITLSGGQKTKLALAKALSDNHSLLLLDEPTNHLSLKAISWLEDYLSKSRATIIIISHDRMFLDKTVTKIIELDSRSHQLISFGGNYSDYLEQKRKKEEKNSQLDEAKRREIRQLKELVKKKKDWAKKASQGPKKTDNEKLLRNAKKDDSKRIDKNRKALEARIEKIEDKMLSKKEKKPLITLENDLKSGQTLIWLKEVQKAYGEKVLFENLDLKIKSGERVVILGENGSGKTSILKMINGETQIDAGEIRKGEFTKIGYLPQEYFHQANQQTALKYFMDNTFLNESDSRTFLASIGLEQGSILGSVSSLSPGEKARIFFAIIDASEANILLLDEPTNHLDLESLEVVETVLSNYSGAYLVVSHDRYFVKQIHPDRVYSIENKSLREVYL